MTKAEVIGLMEFLSDAYPNFKAPKENVLKTWIDILKDTDKRDAYEAIKEHMATSPFPPKLSDITKERKGLGMTDEEVRAKYGRKL